MQKIPSIHEESLRRDLTSLGVEAGMTVIVHSSLSALGWVLGGAPAVVRALVGALGEEGTLAMPAATPSCGGPASWSHRRVSGVSLAVEREHLPVFDLRTTPTSLGVIPETFRTWPGTLRSDHPLESVCARGPRASEVVRDHPMSFSEGLGSPFDKLYQLDAQVLLLGVGFNRCTALHYAESLVDRRRTMKVSLPVVEEGRRRWIEVTNVADDNDTHFPVIGDRFLAEGVATAGTVGSAKAILFPMRGLVDFAREYFEKAF